MRAWRIVALTGLLIAVTGCMRAPVVPPIGIIFTDYQAPLDIDYDKTQLGKAGTSSSHCVLALVAWGDASTQAAARENNISTIDHADYQYFNVIGIYQKYTTIVYGR